MFHPNILNEDIYPDINDFAHDVAKAYHDSLLKFYDLGARYIQLDDVYWANLTSGTQNTRGRDRSESEKKLHVNSLIKLSMKQSVVYQKIY